MRKTINLTVNQLNKTKNCINYNSIAPQIIHSVNTMNLSIILQNYINISLKTCLVYKKQSLNELIPYDLLKIYTNE